MSKETREFFEQLKAGDKPSLAETLKAIGGQMWDASQPLFNHGRDELAAALFAGHAHVMYGHDDVEKPNQDTNKELPEVQMDQGRDL